MKHRIIGMFDSGVGGLTVMKELLREMPDLRIIYFGDTARVPYGNRTPDELIRFGQEIITFLISQGAEAIVVACNSSSATALPTLRKQFDIPLIGTIEPGAKRAVELTRSGRIGLIATEATVRSQAYVSAVSQVLAKGVLPQQPLRSAWKSGTQPVAVVKSQPCPLFVPLVEAGLFNSAEAKGIAKSYLAPLQEAQVDTVILGCTHYPFLNPILHEILGDNVALADPATAMIEELKEVLADPYPLAQPAYKSVASTLSEAEELPAKEHDAQLAKEHDAQLAKELDTQLAGEVDALPVMAHAAKSGVKPLKRPAEDAAKPWQVKYFVSGDPELFKQVGNTLLQEPIDHVSQVVWGHET